MDINQDLSVSFVVCLRLMSRSKTFYQQAIATTGQNAFDAGYFSRCQSNLYRMVGGKEVCDKSLRFAVRFASAGITQMIRDWIEGGMAETPEDMSKLFMDNMPPGFLLACKAQNAPQ